MNKSLEQYMPDGSKLPYRFMKYRIHKILLVCCNPTWSLFGVVLSIIG